MSFAVGGEKNGFDRSTFMTAFTQSGILLDNRIARL